MKNIRYRIKDIAQLAKVSVGTVDRVIHNRGEVSVESRRKVEETIAKVGYKPSIFSSSYAGLKSYKLVIILPQHHDGDYWDLCEQGIKKALFELSKIKITVNFFLYNQLDPVHCDEIFALAFLENADAFLIGPVFQEETKRFAHKLTENNIPYVFIDNMVESSAPMAFFGMESYSCGIIQARMLINCMLPGIDIAVMSYLLTNDNSYIENVSKKNGFISHIQSCSPQTKILYSHCFTENEEENWKLMDHFFQENLNIGGVVVFNSRAHIVASYFHMKGCKNIRIVGSGAIPNNINWLKDGYIDFLIAERPEYQGYMGIRAILEFFSRKIKPKVNNFTPIDILVKESADFYTCF